ncbi:hypothetical protein SprV_0200731600 [Sparganum proliferum]
MARGNQRELARQKNQQKQQELKKSQAAKDKQGNKGLTLEERRQRANQRPLRIASEHQSRALTGGRAKT